MSRPRVASESGQVSMLVLGMALMCFAIAAVAVDGTRAFILRRTLQNAADASALAGVSELDEEVYYSSGGDDVVLDAAEARRVAFDWLARRELDAVATVDASETRVIVRLEAELRTSWLGLIGIGSVPVAAASEAEAVVGKP